MSSSKRNKRKSKHDVESIETPEIQEKKMSMTKPTSFKRLAEKFFNKACKEFAVDVLGKILVRRLENGKELRGRIIETEAYLGGEDKASNTYNNRRTPTNEPMYMSAGTSFVYMTYGMYHCFNISSLEPGAAVLIRAVEPIQNFEIMEELRTAKSKRKNKSEIPKQLYKIHELCNGPSKLCMSMNIEKKNLNKENMINSDQLWLEEDEDYKNDHKVVVTSRIGIASAGSEWANKPLRYYIFGNSSVSKRDKNAENVLENI